MRKQSRDQFNEQYNTEVQHHLLNCLISDPDTFARCRNIIRDEYFDDPLAPTVRFVLQHADEYRVIPDPALVQAKTGIQLVACDIIKHQDWFLNEIQAFCRRRAVDNIVMQGFDLEPEELDARLKEALTISLMSDLGTNYFENPAERLHRMRDRSSFITTGWKSLDDKLFGGFSKGGLNVFCGGSGSGKSLLLQNLAINWVFAGYVVLYFTLELSEDLVSLRMDSMISGKPTKEVFRNIDDTALMLGIKGKSYIDKLFVKKLPEGSTTVNDLRAMVKEYEIRIGRKPDAILIDYLDLMYPTNGRIDPSNLFIKDKFVSEELRAFYHETNAFGATASQLNRQSVEADGNFDHSHIAGGISKINTADNVIAINAPPHMKERGEYELVLLKTRSSSSNGHRLKLHYDSDCMRMTDMQQTSDRPTTYNNIKAELKTPTSEQITPQSMLDMMNNERSRR